MDFAIVGTVNRDRIVTVDGAVHESLGGILYNVLVLARCVGPGDVIHPIARVGDEDRAAVCALLERCPGVDTSGLAFYPGGSNEATLAYASADARTETLADRVGPLSDEEVLAAGRADFAIANLISGWDFTPEQLAEAVGVRGTRALLDVQSLTLAPPGADGLRRPRRIPEAECHAWCRAAEIVKGNEAEIGLFVGRALESPADFAWAAERVTEAGARTLVVTLGARGAYVAAAGGRRDAPRDRSAARRGESAASRVDGSLPRINARVVPAVAGVAVADTTGCGDAFASGFVAALAREADPFSAAYLGNAAAALVAERRGLHALLDLPDPRPLAESLIRETR